jgi:hypothetical protein
MNTIKKILLLFLIWLIYAVTRRRLSLENNASIRQKYIAATSFAVITALLLILVRPKRGEFEKRCPDYANSGLGAARYCRECGSRV